MICKSDFILTEMLGIHNDLTLKTSIGILLTGKKGSILTYNLNLCLAHLLPSVSCNELLCITNKVLSKVDERVINLMLENTAKLTCEHWVNCIS